MTLFAFFKIDLDSHLFFFWSGYEVARGHISVNMTGKLVFFSLKAELCFLAKHVCLRFARHLNYKRIKLCFSKVQLYNNNHAVFFLYK